MRTSRSILAAGAAVAVLVLALVVGLQLRDRSDTTAAPSPSPSASTVPGAVAPTVSPSATPTSSSAAVLDDRFGFIVSEVGAGASIRRETGSDVASINGILLVPSPTGDRIAYVASAPSAPTIHVRTLADGTDRTILSGLAPTDRVTRLAWSSDGTGLLVATGSGSEGPGTESTLGTVDLSGGLPTLVAKRNDGLVYAPIAWDRAAKLVAAAETRVSGFASAYLTFDLSQTPPRANSVPTPGRVSIPQASTDAKYALASDLDLHWVRYWPLADYGAGKIAGQTTGGALWQPGSHRIGIVFGDAFLLFQVDDPTTSTLFRGLKTGTATQPGASLRTFRVDGSAVVTGVPIGTGLGSTEYTLTRLADGASATFQTTGGLGGSVRLPTAAPSPTPTGSPAAAAQTGAITGRLGYPADYVPPLTVYAISTTDQRVWYSFPFAGFGNPPRPTLPPGGNDGYTITGVAPGTYWVLAYRDDGLRPDPGYFSRQPVTVVAGQTTRGIDITNWGPPEQSSPTFPPRPTPRP